MTQNFYSELAKLLSIPETIAVATVVSTRGSVPREVGAKMLVKATGAIMGTVGGGCGEAQVWRTALQVLDSGQPVLEFVDLTDEIRMNSGAVCGGTMDVLIERWSGALDLEMAESISDYLRRRELAVLVTVTSVRPGGALPRGTRLLLDENGETIAGSRTAELEEALDWAGVFPLKTEGQMSSLVQGPTRGSKGGEPETVGLLLEVLKPEPRLVILGAGHIAVPLAQMGSALGFEIAVLDDRRDFANRKRFPDASLVMADEFGKGISQLVVDRDTYVVLITRGHQHDVECLLELVDADWAYLGMIGSRRRVEAVFELLEERGVPREKLRRVHAPIGIDIGAKTPAEIALSILAEIVSIRRGGSAASLSAR